MSPCGGSGDKKGRRNAPVKAASNVCRLFETGLSLHLNAEQRRPGQTPEERRDVHPGFFPNQVFLVRIRLQKSFNDNSEPGCFRPNCTSPRNALDCLRESQSSDVHRSLDAPQEVILKWFPRKKIVFRSPSRDRRLRQ